MKNLYYTYPIAAGILFGSAGVFVRFLNEGGFSVQTIVGQRAIFAALILGAVLFLYDRSLMVVRPKDLWIMALAGTVGVMVMNLCLNIAIIQLTMALAATLLSLFPVFVLLLSLIIFKEKITLKKGVCCVLAVAGCYMVSGMPGINTGVSLSVIGLIAGILTPLFYSIYNICSKLAVERGYHPLTITFYSILSMAVVMVPLTRWGEIASYTSEDPMAHWIVMIAHAVCVAVLPYFLYTIGIAHIDAGKAALLSSCEPAAAMLFGALFFGEIPTPVMMSGLGLVIVAVAMISHSRSSPS